MILHAEKRNGFVMMDKALLNDPKLSLKAKGLLVYLLSKPPDWRPQVEDICKHCKERPGAVRATLNELRNAGYAFLLMERANPTGKMTGSQWVIREKPTSDPITEIAVSRNSEKHHPNKNDKIQIRSRSETTLSELDLKGPDGQPWKPPATVEQIKAEAKKEVKRLLGLPEDSPFWREWLRRIEATPLRVIFALDPVKDDLIDKKPSRNPSGKANWCYLNIDLQTGRFKKWTRKAQAISGKP